MIEIDDLPTGAILVAALIVASAMMLPAVPTTKPSDAQTGDIQTPQPHSATQPSHPSSPSGSFYAVPDSHTETVTPKLAPPEVRASNGSQTMQVSVTTVKGQPALKLSDDRVHDGRWVSIDMRWFQETLGDVPEVAYITHESGRTYGAQMHVRDDSAAFYVDGFSENLVTFSGEIRIQDSPASDGTQHQYELSSLDSVTAPNVTLTGWNSTAWDNASAQGLGNGGTLAVNPAGHSIIGPNNGEPEVVLTGAVTNGSSNTLSGTNVGPGESAAITIDGTAEPIGPSGEPQLTVTGHPTNRTEFETHDTTSRLAWYDSGADANGSVTFWNPPSVVDRLKFNEVASSSADALVIDIYAVNEDSDTVYTEGSLVKDNWSPKAGTGWESVDISDYQTSGTVTFEFVVASGATGSGSLYVAGDSTDEQTTTYYDGQQSVNEAPAVYALSQSPSSVSVTANDGTTVSFGAFTAGESKTNAIDLSTSASSLSFDMSGGRVDWSLEYTGRYATENPAIDLDGDGTNEISYSGVLSNGQTVTYQAASLGPSDDTLTVSTNSGTVVDVAVHLQEVTQTRDPSVSLNGHVQDYIGTLADGNTTTLQFDPAYLRNGTNYVNVSVGDGTLSSDAPTPMVGIEYSHEASDKRSVTYQAEEWSEHYNVTKTFGDATQNATLTIPFQGNVVGIRNVDMRTNGGVWQNLTAADYSLSNTTLTVDLGDLTSDDTVTVRATGSKVQVANGTIQVLEPTTSGTAIHSKVEVTRKQAGFHISYGGTSGRIYYTENETWAIPESYHFADSSGHKRLYLPNAQAGHTFNVHSIPVTARPTAGDIHITDTNGNWTVPVAFNVSYGSTSGNTVEYTLQNAKSETKYILYSRTAGLVRDSGTASSPLTLTDDDSKETLVFRIDDGSTGGSNGGSSGGSGPGGIGPFPNPGDGDASWLPLGAVALALAGLIVAGNQPNAVKDAGDDLGSAVDNFLSAVPYIGGTLGDFTNTLVGAVGSAVAVLVGNRIVVAALASAIVIGAIQGGIVALPQGSLVIVVVAGVAIASGVALREFDEFSMERWLVVVVLTGVIALQVVSPADTSLSAAIMQSDIFPLLAAGGLYLAYKLVQGLRQPDEVTNVVVAGDTQEGDS